ncbi:MAG TPA: hypothetical protein VEI82_04905, partial [Myxococcota bacterium]|nr:hypothetical protein [Myxococcota bacterium]
RPLAPGAELASWKEEVLGVHPDARVSSPWTPPQTQNHEPNPGNALAFRFTDALWGEREEFESLLYVFEYDGWIPTYRISYPSSQHKLANLLAQVFVQAFKWRGGS